jgi:nucleoside phosphorylase
MSELSLSSRRTSVAVTTDKTLTAADSGIVQNVTAAATITLPATAVGISYVIRVGGAGATDGSFNVNVSPNSADQIIGNGFTAADNKDAIATAQPGGTTEIGLVADGASGWYVTYTAGTWTREA